jgi:hypothetical protein
MSCHQNHTSCSWHCCDCNNCNRFFFCQQCGSHPCGAYGCGNLIHENASYCEQCFETYELCARCNKNPGVIHKHCELCYMEIQHQGINDS